MDDRPTRFGSPRRREHSMLSILTRMGVKHPTVTAHQSQFNPDGGQP